MFLPPGTILKGGTYRIIRYIASGGFGCTYEAVHLMLNRRVAIKEFFPKSMCNRSADNSRITVGTQSQVPLVNKLKNKFINEACSIAQLSHPNIVKVSDVFGQNGTAYYVMEYIDGKPLSRIIEERGRLPEAEALSYINQVCNALDYVHGQNRLHLDIKPANIMIDQHGRAVLIDFGASKQYDEENGENSSTLLGKTPGFAPIEQMGNNVAHFKPATDIYSVGATLYKCLTGKTPLDATLLANGEVPEPLPPYVSEKTRKAIKSAMEVSSKNRPQTVTEFKALLNNPQPKRDPGQISGLINGPIYPPEPEPQSKPKKKKKALRILLYWIGGIIGAFLLFILFGVILTLCDRESNNDYSGSDVIEAGIDSIAQAGVHNRPVSETEDNISEGRINIHPYVDLGLPSGVKWAVTNIGASSPEDHGDYFAWGETKPKSSYTKDNSETFGKDPQWLFDHGYIYSNYNLSFEHDAARQNWGGTWRLPTADDIDELVKNTTKERTTINGKVGILVTSKTNGNSIFLPEGGWMNNSTLSVVNEEGRFWTSSLSLPENDFSSSMCLSGDYLNSYVGFNRSHGANIRPVCN